MKKQPVLRRRTVLKTIGGAAGSALVFTGFGSASDGQARYIARTSRDVVGAVESAGFEVLTELAGGEVILVKGPENAVDDLTDVRGVSTAAPDIEVELAEPESAADVDPEVNHGDVSASDVYDEFLWDKQVQQVREAHDYATGAGRTVAIIDTGVDDTHPDLDVDVEKSANIVDGQPEEHEGDSWLHGTHVAGIAAGTEDVAMLGTAPDATIVSVRVLGPESSTFGDILAGMEYAAEVGADAGNISLGFMAPPQELQGAVGILQQLFEPVANQVRRKGTLLVGSAGNAETNLQWGWLRLWNGLAGVMGVSALTPDGLLSYYSNYGTNDVDVGAPGGGYETLEKTLETEPNEVERPWPLNAVFSPVPHIDLVPDPYMGAIINGEHYAWLMGTSMSAPQVTGLAALVRELDPDATPQEVKNAIAQGAEGGTGRSDPELGAGRSNALNTVEHVSD